MSAKIITISRQFGSGGRTIAKQVADKLGYAYYDKEIIDNVALKTGFTRDFIASNGEEAPGKTVFSYGLGSAGVPGVMNGMTTLDYIYSVQRQLILDLADKNEPMVIVGRCADYILREHDDVLNVFVYADMDFRIDRIVRLYGESEKKPEKRLSDKDKKRAANYKHFTEQEWGNTKNYDICLNSGKIGIDRCVEIIESIAKI